MTGSKLCAAALSHRIDIDENQNLAPPGHRADQVFTAVASKEVELSARLQERAPRPDASLFDTPPGT